jgi:adenylate cyclase
VAAFPDDAWDISSMTGCFDGVIPPVIATCSSSGEPNVTHLSQLYLVDDRHVALSNQFFGKTSANLAENPQACVLVTDSQTYETFRLVLRFERTEASGPVFEKLRASIDAIGALMDMDDVFGLRGADIYEILGVELLPGAARP